MLMQNAQMHQIIMHNMMLKAMPPMAMPPLGGPSRCTPPITYQVHKHVYSPGTKILLLCPLKKISVTKSIIFISRIVTRPVLVCPMSNQGEALSIIIIIMVPVLQRHSCLPSATLHGYQGCRQRDISHLSTK